MARILYTDMSGQERSVPIGADAPVVSIGRATDCTIRSNRKSVSRRHAEFRFANGQFEVVDLNSSNGTYLIINEERRPVLGREYLAHNDEVWCGDFILRFFEEDAATADGYDDSTFNAPGQLPPQHQQGGYDSFASYGPQNGQFGQPMHSQPQHGFDGPASKPPEPWSSPPPPKNGPMFTQPPPPQQNRFVPQSPPFGDPFQNDAFPYDSGFGGESAMGNEPSFGNEPPDFGEPVGGDDHTAGYSGKLDTSTQNQSELAAYMQSQDSERLEQERNAYAELADRQKGEIDDLQERLKDAEGRVRELQHEIEEIRVEQESATSVATPPAEVARLRDDLASAESEADDLRAQLDAARSEAQSAYGELQTLRAELDERRSDTTAAELRRELEALREENATLEHELASARQMAAEPDHEAEAEIGRLRDQLAGKDRDVGALENEVDRLSAEMQAMERAASEQSKSDAQKLREETEALRRELDRHKRLVEEFEKRNRELQADLEAANDNAETAEARIAEAHQKRDEVEAELESLAADLENARTERDQTLAEIVAIKAEGSVADLHNEIEGLKHRLKMEKDRAGKGDRKLADEIDRLNGVVKELEAHNASLAASLEAASAVGGATADDLAVLREKVTALDRIVDAIVRTNLDPLSTVDRIRLQSAIRDTDPKATLAALLELTSPE